jgi:hypothetical protein
LADFRSNTGGAAIRKKIGGDKYFNFFLILGRTPSTFNNMIKLHPINGASYANINETFIPLFDDEPTRIESLRTDIERTQFLRELLPLGSCYRGALERALEDLH